MVDLKIFHDVTSSCKIFLFLKRLSTMQCDCSSECINISRTFLKQLESMRNEKRREGERNANMHSYFIKNITKWQCNWKVMAVANCNFHFYSMLFLLALYLWFSVNDGIVLHTHTHSCFAVVARRQCEDQLFLAVKWFYDIAMIVGCNNGTTEKILLLSFR